MKPDPTWDTPSCWFKQLPVKLATRPGDSRLAFFPQWPVDWHSGSVDGMSGGPIVVLGWRRPVVVAFQSSESTETASTADCPSKVGDISLLWASELCQAFEGLERILRNTDQT